MRRQFSQGDVVIEGRLLGYDGFSRLHVLRLRHRKHDGGWSGALEREVYERANAAAVLLYDPDRRCIALLEQFRPGAYLSGRNPWQLEPVAGIVASGEYPKDVAIRETREEAGCEVLGVMPIGAYLVSPGCATEMVHCYVGRISVDGVGGIFGNVDEGEDIRVHVVSLADARRMLEDGQFEYALTLICVQWLLLNEARLHNLWGQGPRIDT